MRRQVLFVQGGGQGAHDEWDNRLVDGLAQVLGQDHEIRYPRMPDEADPAYPPWKQALEMEFAGLKDGAVLVGHSIGAAILVNAVAADPPHCELGGIFLVAAPFIGDGGWPSDGIESREARG